MIVSEQMMRSCINYTRFNILCTFPLSQAIGTVREKNDVVSEENVRGLEGFWSPITKCFLCK